MHIYYKEEKEGEAAELLIVVSLARIVTTFLIR